LEGNARVIIVPPFDHFDFSWHAREDSKVVVTVQGEVDASPRSCTVTSPSTGIAQRYPGSPLTRGLEGRRSDHEIVGDFAKTGLERDLTSSVARKVILSIAEGQDPKAEDVLLMVNSALKTPFAKAARAVIETEPRYVRARLIELAAMMATRDEAEAVVG
jgi:hypothetical protein